MWEPGRGEYTHRASCKISWEQLCELLNLPEDTLLQGIQHQMKTNEVEFFISHPSFLKVYEGTSSQQLQADSKYILKIKGWNL